jgi:hypothetical protein
MDPWDRERLELVASETTEERRTMDKRSRRGTSQILTFFIFSIDISNVLF